jgi:hypothetical protein
MMEDEEEVELKENGVNWMKDLEADPWAHEAAHKDLPEDDAMGIRHKAAADTVHSHTPRAANRSNSYMSTLL